MHDAVKNGFSKRAFIAAELVVPSAGIVLGAEDCGGFLPSSVEQFQDVMLFRFRRLQQKPFINDEQDRVGIFGLNLLVGAICTHRLKIQEHVGQAHILCFITLFAGFHVESAGHVGLTAPGRTRNEQIPVLRDVLTGCETFNQAAIKLPTGSVVDISNVCRLVEPDSLDQTLQAVALAVIVFDVYQKAEAILERNILRLGVIPLCDKGI